MFTTSKGLRLLQQAALMLLPARGRAEWQTDRQTDELAIPRLRAKLSALPVRWQGPIPTGTAVAGHKTRRPSGRRKKMNSSVTVTRRTPDYAS